ncbi:vegetative cell wall protein gp1-like [Alligator sinensis]|uniref:Vegetative cell wall protein gp1-like n=1 Tax=Alligator sinensis TaxID=38654 RepID=A0A3Q0FJW2_ALLSI|nr:vegetative cell wall protein gp1-like [Alligator sinensis]
MRASERCWLLRLAHLGRKWQRQCEPAPAADGRAAAPGAGCLATPGACGVRPGVAQVWEGRGLAEMHSGTAGGGGSQHWACWGAAAGAVGYGCAGGQAGTAGPRPAAAGSKKPRCATKLERSQPPAWGGLAWHLPWVHARSGCQQPLGCPSASCPRAQSPALPWDSHPAPLGCPLCARAESAAHLAGATGHGQPHSWAPCSPVLALPPPPLAGRLAGQRGCPWGGVGPIPGVKASAPPPVSCPPSPSCAAWEWLLKASALSQSLLPSAHRATPQAVLTPWPGAACQRAPAWPSLLCTSPMPPDVLQAPPVPPTC